MNKKLLALAVGAAIAMPVAALAEGPTLYGQIDVSLDNMDNGTTDTWTIEDNASRLGVKGSAETGVDGLKGIYVAEFGLNADDGDADNAAGNDPITQRNIYVGLAGNFGAVLMGNLDTPTKSVQGKVDQFNDTAADISAYVAGELRAPNVLAYATPKIADSLTATVALWQSEAAGDGIGEAISASVVYEQDALYLGLGMDMEVPSTGGVAVTAAPTLNDITRVVAGYTTDTLEIGFMYQMAEETVAANEDTTMLLGGAFKSGDLKVKLQYGQTEGDTAGVTNTETMLAVGADYNVGKATTAYGLLAINEDDAGLENQTLSLGIKQKF